MAMLAVPVSGPYLGVWDGQALGVQSDDGYRLTCQIHGQRMDATDQFGKTMVEGVYQGQNWTARLLGLEWKAAMLQLLQAFGFLDAEDISPTLFGLTINNDPVCNVGDLYSRYANPLVLTAILANPPTTPQSLTASKAIISPEQSSEFMLTSAVRELPLEMVLLPYTTTIGSDVYAVPFTCL